jgi:hypothetical protein
MDKFLEFIADKRAKLLKQKQRLEEELSDLERTEKLYRASGALSGETQESRAPRHVPQSQLPYLIPPGVSAGTPLALQEGTIKDRVVQILAGEPNGLTSGQILERLKQSGLTELARSSLSPQLSRLKAAELLIRDQGIWKLPRNTEAEAVSAASASDSPASSAGR